MFQEDEPVALLASGGLLRANRFVPWGRQGRGGEGCGWRRCVRFCFADGNHLIRTHSDKTNSGKHFNLRSIWEGLPHAERQAARMGSAKGQKANTCRLFNGAQTILAAQSPADAIRISGSHPGLIHLMVTDVIMPGMNGAQLATHLSPLRPEMLVLYVSGYTDDTIVPHEVLDPGLAFLQKPFSPKALARRVSELLATVSVPRIHAPSVAPTERPN